MSEEEAPEDSALDVLSRMERVVHHGEKRKRIRSQQAVGGSPRRKRRRKRHTAVAVNKVHLKAKLRPASHITMTKTCQLFLNVREGLVTRPAITTGSAASSSTDVPVARTEPIPATVGICNLMVATWSIGKQCRKEDFVDRLCAVGFDFILIQMATSVEQGDTIPKFLEQVAAVEDLAPIERTEGMFGQLFPRSRGVWPLVQRVRAEKTVRALGTTVMGIAHDKVGDGVCVSYVALHKAKVLSAVYEEQKISRDGLPYRGICFGLLTVTMDTERQRMDRVNVGIIDAGGRVQVQDTDVLESWIKEARLDMLTGFFGKFPTGPQDAAYVSDLARRTGAISFCPLYQSIRSTSGRAYVHPSWYIFFGYYKAIKVPEKPPQLSDTIRLGDDLWSDMMPSDDVPLWLQNDKGSRHVCNLGMIKMLDPYPWDKWFDGCFQTCVWLGTSTQGRGAQARHIERKGKGKGKGKRFAFGVGSRGAASSREDFTIRPQSREEFTHRRG